MNLGYIKDHADRTWCINPRHPAWRDAFVKAWHAINGTVPSTPISTAFASGARFQRGLK